MIQDKLDVVKQVMVRVNIDILGIGELKWTITGIFNSDDHNIYTVVDKKPLKGMELPSWSTKESEM